MTRYSNICKRNKYPIDVVDYLVRRYDDMCQHGHLVNPVPILNQLYNVTNDQSAIRFGKEAWNRKSLDEMCDRYRYFGNHGATEIPYTVLSYGKRLQRGRRLFAQIGIDPERSAEVTYPDIAAAYKNREWIGKHVFTEAAGFTSPEAMSKVPPAATSLLSTLNQFQVMIMLADGSLPKEGVFVIEDDAIPVPDFKRKLAEVYRQLTIYHPDWDVVFAGTCFGISFENRTTTNLHQVNTTRCFNAVMVSKKCAETVLAAGAVVESYTAIDHLFNRLIPELGLNAFMVEPPLIYEDSKQEGISYQCR